MELVPAVHFAVLSWHLPYEPAKCRQVQDAALALGVDVGTVRVAVVLSSARSWAPTDAQGQLDPHLQEAWANPILQQLHVDRWPTLGQSYVLVQPLPGVTDSLGRTAQGLLQALGLGLPEEAQQWIFAGQCYLFAQALTDDDLRLLLPLLANPAVERTCWGRGEPAWPLVPMWLEELPNPLTSNGNLPIPLPATDAGLVDLSQAYGWALNLQEMQAIAAFAAVQRPLRVAQGLPEDLTRCEWETLAQTWSEHCKHKEFNAIIDMTWALPGQSPRSERISGLMPTYVMAPTQEIRAKYEAMGQDWVVSAFTDNAGTVVLSADELFVLKVETHNSPSAIDPYGGAMTGLLGVHRDALGMGIGGARLLLNTDVLCFGPADYAKPLLKGQLHPQRVAQGVIAGIAAAGNHSGVPTVNGAILFDDRFAGKPLVYCGVGAILPRLQAGRPAHVKTLRPGDRVVMVGGAVGRDGIHGATFSSTVLLPDVPHSVVQIGDPLAQQRVAEFLQQACARGLVQACTDNGAGGLSSSVGELALLAGGVRVELSAIPTKYPGLQPWELWVSEAQERMTLAVQPSDLPAILALANEHGTVATDLGAFADSGVLDVRYRGEPIAYLPLEFLHHGVPRLHLHARWTPPRQGEPEQFSYDIKEILLRLLSSPMVCSRESIVRQYDHEVTGKIVIKPYMGTDGHGPQDAAVVRANWTAWHGVAVASGICPKFGDLDPYHMACGAFDEAVRSLIAVGARLPLPGESNAWSGCDNFCVPNSVYDAENNPQGAEKLGQLVRMCEGLRDMCLAFDVPMTSGKDSMKNDFRSEGLQISVPPTLLITLTAKLGDVRKALTSGFGAQGDGIWLVGPTYDELGGSEFYRFFKHLGANVPQVRPQQARQSYLALMDAHARGFLASAHDLSDGGLAITLAECCIGGAIGADIDLQVLEPDLTTTALLFAESHSRLLVTVPEHLESEFAVIMPASARRLGAVGGDNLLLRRGSEQLAHIDVSALIDAYQSGGQ